MAQLWRIFTCVYMCDIIIFERSVDSQQIISKIGNQEISVAII